MLGLTKLLHQLDPETTVQKFMFLVKNALQYSNPLTATISFSALFALVALRVFKNKFKHIWWIYRVPEVLVVVIASTSKSWNIRLSPLFELTHNVHSHECSIRVG